MGSSGSVYKVHDAVETLGDEPEYAEIAAALRRLGERQQAQKESAGAGGDPAAPGAMLERAVTDAVAKAAPRPDVFVSHAKQIPSSEDRAVWVADLVEQRGLVAFFDRCDLKDITEEAIKVKIEASRAVALVVDPGTFHSMWVSKEVLWAANAGVPIVPLYDSDLYRWDQIQKWTRLHPWGFQRQCLALTKSHRRDSHAKLRAAIEKALDDGIQKPDVPYKMASGEDKAEHVHVVAASSLGTETHVAVESALRNLTSRLSAASSSGSIMSSKKSDSRRGSAHNTKAQVSTPFSLIVAAYTHTHDANAVAAALHEMCPGTPIAGITTCRGVVCNQSWVTHRKEFALALWAVSDLAGDYAVVHVMQREDDDFHQQVRDKVGSAVKMRSISPSFALMLGAPGNEEQTLAVVQEVLGDGVPILGGSSADNAVAGAWSQFAVTGSSGFGVSSSPSVSTSGVIFVVGWASCEVATTMTGGFYGTEHSGEVTKISDGGRTMVEIDGRPAGQVYDEWSDGALTRGLDFDEKGVGNVLAPSSFLPLGEPLGSKGYFRVLHPAFLDQKTMALTTFADAHVGMRVQMLSGSKETLTTKISESVRALLDDNSKEDGKLTFDPEDTIGALMIFCGGLVMAIDEEMPTAVEAVSR